MRSAELLEVAEQLASEAERFDAQFSERLNGLEERAGEVGQAWSGSNLGYHAKVYCDGLRVPPPGAHFSAEWGLMETFVEDTRGDWREMPFDAVRNEVLNTPLAKVLKELRSRANKSNATV